MPLAGGGGGRCRCGGPCRAALFVELGDAILEKGLVLLQALDLFVEFELGCDSVVDLGEGALFLS